MQISSCSKLGKCLDVFIQKIVFMDDVIIDDDAFETNMLLENIHLKTLEID